jgi:hypothetical protein
MGDAGSRSRKGTQRASQVAERNAAVFSEKKDRIQVVPRSGTLEAAITRYRFPPVLGSGGRNPDPPDPRRATRRPLEAGVVDNEG